MTTNRSAQRSSLSIKILFEPTKPGRDDTHSGLKYIQYGSTLRPAVRLNLNLTYQSGSGLEKIVRWFPPSIDLVPNTNATLSDRH